MADFIPLLTKVCADTMIELKLDPPIPIALLDLGGNEFYSADVTKDEQGVYGLSNGHFLGEGGVRPKPWSVRFSPKGQHSFERSFPG